VSCEKSSTKCASELAERRSRDHYRLRRRELRQAAIVDNPYKETSIVGASLSVLGGYVCARIARRNERRVAAVQALLVSVLGALGGGATLGPLANAVLVLLTFASVMAGGELGRRHNLAKARAAGDLSAA
jgi:hypothetical protein